ncbi:hypothetical protein LTR27_010381 [Elasticomyces elasticus]|nr:hypothetical protein LTR27_010381 [Elasticomyces elasticus]
MVRFLVLFDEPWVFKADTPFARCTEWKMQRQTQTCQLIDCPESCGDSGADGFSQCVTDCAYACPLEESLLPGNMNHLNFEIKHDGHGDDAREMTYDICNKALTDITLAAVGEATSSTKGSGSASIQAPEVAKGVSW